MGDDTRSLSVTARGCIAYGVYIYFPRDRRQCTVHHKEESGRCSSMYPLKNRTEFQQFLELEPVIGTNLEQLLRFFVFFSTTRRYDRREANPSRTLSMPILAQEKRHYSSFANDRALRYHDALLYRWGGILVVQNS